MTLTLSKRELWTLGVLLLAFLGLYGGILVDLGHVWLNDDNYAHGIFVLPMACYLAWRNRASLMRLPVRPSAAGLFVIAAGLMVLLVGTAGIEFFLTRISIIGVLAGIVLYLFGWAHLRVLAFPLVFLVLMIPLPAIVFNHITFPLQLVASRLGVNVIQALEIPVLREGNVIVLANTTLEVAEACSGIRSLVSLLTLTILYGHLGGLRRSMQVVVTVAAVPVAILANGIRVAGAGMVAHYYGAPAATGFLHGFSGWLLFTTSFVVLVAGERVINAMFMSPRARLLGRRWMVAAP